MQNVRLPPPALRGKRGLKRTMCVADTSVSPLNQWHLFVFPRSACSAAEAEHCLKIGGASGDLWDFKG